MADNDKLALEMWDRRMIGITAREQPGAHRALAVDMFVSNPALQSQFIELAFEHGVLEYDQDTSFSDDGMDVDVEINTVTLFEVDVTHLVMSSTFEAIRQEVLGTIGEDNEDSF